MLGGLRAGNYAVHFRDAAGKYAPEYWQDQPSVNTAGAVAVTSGQTHTGIDAQLEVGGTIAGTVTAGAQPVEHEIVERPHEGRAGC